MVLCRVFAGKHDAGHGVEGIVVAIIANGLRESVVATGAATTVRRRGGGHIGKGHAGKGFHSPPRNVIIDQVGDGPTDAVHVRKTLVDNVLVRLRLHGDGGVTAVQKDQRGKTRIDWLLPLLLWISIMIICSRRRRRYCRCSSVLLLLAAVVRGYGGRGVQDQNTFVTFGEAVKV
jgi:hypothetical protein